MNDSDPIVDEVRRIRDAHAGRFNYDLRAIFKDIKEQQIRSGLKFVSFARDGSVIFAPPEAEEEPNKTLPPTGPPIAASDSMTTSQAGAAEL